MSREGKCVDAEGLLDGKTKTSTSEKCLKHNALAFLCNMHRT
jgi:hypothetical protein